VKEIDDVIAVLARRTKNNRFNGEPGVGKTAVAEGLAQLILTEKVPIS
jgi:ATP-dependent Clp protease ATP-binding subunit ClpC